MLWLIEETIQTLRLLQRRLDSLSELWWIYKTLSVLWELSSKDLRLSSRHTYTRTGNEMDSDGDYSVPEFRHTAL